MDGQTMAAMLIVVFWLNRDIRDDVFQSDENARM